jgi:hypothetical protein
MTATRASKPSGMEAARGGHQRACAGWEGENAVISDKPLSVTACNSNGLGRQSRRVRDHIDCISRHRQDRIRCNCDGNQPRGTAINGAGTTLSATDRAQSGRPALSIRSRKAAVRVGSRWLLNKALISVGRASDCATRSLIRYPCLVNVGSRSSSCCESTFSGSAKQVMLPLS